jgi:hypothetical protein
MKAARRNLKLRSPHFLECQARFVARHSCV